MVNTPQFQFIILLLATAAIETSSSTGSIITMWW